MVKGIVRVYVAGPYTKGDVVLNIRRAIEAGDDLLVRGYAPYVPHLNFAWHMIRPHDYRMWLELDKSYLICCDYVLRLPGESPGADEEVALAKEVGIPVVYSLNALPWLEH